MAKVENASHCDAEDPTGEGCTFPCGGGYSTRRHNIFVRYAFDALAAVLHDDAAARDRLNNLKRDKNLKEITGPGLFATNRIASSR